MTAQNRSALSAQEGVGLVLLYYPDSAAGLSIRAARRTLTAQRGCAPSSATIRRESGSQTVSDSDPAPGFPSRTVTPQRWSGVPGGGRERSRSSSPASESPSPACALLPPRACLRRLHAAQDTRAFGRCWTWEGVRKRRV